MKSFICGAFLGLVGFALPFVSEAFLASSPLLEERPITVTMLSPEHFTGYTEGGYVYVQRRIVADAAVRIHKFSIADTEFYISDRGMIVAANDLEAVSIYLALVS